MYTRKITLRNRVSLRLLAATKGRALIGVHFLNWKRKRNISAICTVSLPKGGTDFYWSPPNLRAGTYLVIIEELDIGAPDEMVLPDSIFLQTIDEISNEHTFSRNRTVNPVFLQDGECRRTAPSAGRGGRA